MFGSRSVPPATSIAAGPSPARICAASTTEVGARYSNHGSRSTLASLFLALFAVAALGRRRDVNRLGIGNRREALRTDAGILACGFQFQGPQNLVRRYRNLVDTHPDRIEYGVRESGHHRQQRPLADFLGAERAIWIRI